MTAKQRTATGRVALDYRPNAGFPVAIRGEGETLEVYDGGWRPVKKDGAGRYWFRSRADLVTFLTDVD